MVGGSLYYVYPTTKLTLMNAVLAASLGQRQNKDEVYENKFK